jgi:MFS family permease
MTVQNADAQADQDGTRTRRYAWYVVAVLFAASVIGYLDRLVLSFLIDPIKADLNLNDAQAGIIIGTAFALFYVLMGLPLGRLIDTRNRTAILSICVALWSIMTAVCGAAVSYATMFMARVGVGVGEAALNPAAVSIISDLFPKEKLARPIAVFSLGIFVGGGLAIMLGGQLVQYFSNLDAISIAGFTDIPAWRVVFFATGLPGVAIALLLFLSVREPRRNAFAQDNETEGTATNAEVLAFLRKNWKLYALLLGALLLFGFYLYSVIAWYPAMLMRTYGLSPATAGWAYGGVYLVFGVAGALSVGTIVRAFDQAGFKESPVMLCLSAMVVMVLPAALGPLMPTPWACLALFAISKFCWAATISVAFTAIAFITPGAMRGLMTSLFMILMNVTGGAFAPGIVGALSDNVFGPDQIRYAIALMAAISIPLAALFFALSRREYRQQLAVIDN